jgi:uncharacterized protein (DUF58 family)
MLGLAAPQRFTYSANALIVYPQIIPLTRVPSLSHSPLGTLPDRQPVFEDPTRVRGKRSYVPGDSLRRVDWKASAATGQIQVKQFEPSIALETAICLNLNGREYDFRTRLDASELAIVTAASLANWVIGRRQSAGLIVAGSDPLNGGATPPPVPARRGRPHLMRLLDVLARIQLGETEPFAGLLRRECAHLPWGTTLLVITSRLEAALFEALFAARRAGQDSMLVVVGRGALSLEDRRRADYFGFPLTLVGTERDLDVWRQ